MGSNKEADQKRECRFDMHPRDQEGDNREINVPGTMGGSSDVLGVAAGSQLSWGILCMWCDKNFKLERKVSENGFILLTGQWIKEAVQVHIVTVYSPCDIQKKRILWDAIKQMKSANHGDLWCISGDFNNIRDPVERVGVCQRTIEESSIKEFNDWIDELEVVEAPWVGRKIT